MTENTVKTSRQRERSPAFPALPLEPALQRLSAFESHFKRSAARPSNIGSAWGLDSKTYIDRIVAALRYFGLLEYHGIGKERQIVISEEGRNLLRVQQDEIKQRLIQRAALRPKQISFFWEEWGDDRPSDNACLDDLMFNHKFSKAGAKDFLKVYDETIAFSGLSKSDKETPEGCGGSVGDDPEGDSGDDREGKDPPPQRQRSFRLHRQEGSGMKEDVFALTEGDVVLQWPEMLSQESFEDLKAWADIVLRKIEREIAVNKLLHEPVLGAMATKYTDDEEGRAAEARDREREEQWTSDE